MKWDDLKVFAAVRRTGSTKGAATELGVDHSTVSRRLAALEEALGLPLFHRTPEGLQATELADRIHPLATQMGALVLEIEDLARGAQGSMEGEVRIAASPILANDFLLPRLRVLQERFPQIEFVTTAGIGRVDVSRREADIAIRTHPQGTQPGGNRDSVERVGRFVFAAYASETYLEERGRPSDPIEGLADHAIVIASAEAPGARWNEGLDPPAEVAVTAYPYASTLAAAVNGMGFAVLPCVMADKAPGLVRVSAALVTWDLWVVSALTAHARVQRVREVLVDLIR